MLHYHLKNIYDCHAKEAEKRDIKMWHQVSWANVSQPVHQDIIP
jgi:hypothetical protein